MALYITAGSPDVRVVSKDVSAELNCVVEMWPYPYQLDHIVGSNGKTYRFEIYVDDCGLMKGLEYNEAATYLAHPYNIVRGHTIMGDALIVPFQKKVEYTLEDYEAMRDGVWVNDEETNVELVEENTRGPDATYRYMSKEQKAEVNKKVVEERPMIKASHKRLQATIDGGKDWHCFSSKQLKALSKKAHLPVTGTNPELAERLIAVCEDASSEEEDIGIDMEKLKLTQEKPRSKEGYTVEELKAFCKKKGCPVSGKKEELILRLLA